MSPPEFSAEWIRVGARRLLARATAKRAGSKGTDPRTERSGADDDATVSSGGMHGAGKDRQWQ